MFFFLLLLYIFIRLSVFLILINNNIIIVFFSSSSSSVHFRFGYNSSQSSILFCLLLDVATLLQRRERNISRNVKLKHFKLTTSPTIGGEGGVDL